ncbi:MAG: hypothetical protein Q9M91_08795 [Candidatus Dojkabacteria bacterium]|nr:hypothetical protein [Candidatus Dojkabacteria bacterium]
MMIFDRNFRQNYISDPNRYLIYVYNILADESDIFIFDEVGDGKLHNYNFKPEIEVDNSFVVQSGDIDLAINPPFYLRPSFIIKKLEILLGTDFDTNIRIAEKLFLGRKDLAVKFEEFILDRNLLNLRLIDMLELAYSVSELEQFESIDIIARSINKVLYMIDFFPTTLLDQDYEEFLSSILKTLKSIFSEENDLAVIKEELDEVFGKDNDSEIRYK